MRIRVWGPRQRSASRGVTNGGMRCYVPNGPNRSQTEPNFIFPFLALFLACLKKKEISHTNSARQWGGECEHVNAVISWELSKTAQNGPFQIPALMLEFPRPSVEWPGSGNILRSRTCRTTTSMFSLGAIR